MQSNFLYILLIIFCLGPNSSFGIDNQYEVINMCEFSHQSQIYIDNTVEESSVLFSALQDEIKQDEYHLFTHGKSGELYIQGEWLSNEQLASWLSNHIDNDVKKLFIYGCEFAKGAKGKQAVAYLELNLGILIAASDDITGVSGDWDLEIGESLSSLIFKEYNFNLQATIVGSSSNCESSSSSTSNTLPVPSGSIGDLLIAAVNSDESGGVNETFSAPAGWTLLQSGNSADTDASLAVFWKVTTSATEGNATFSVSIQDEICAAIVRFDNVIIPNSGSPVEVFALASGNSGQANPAAVTTLTDLSTVVNIISIDDDDAPLTPPTGTTEMIDIESDANSLGIAYQHQPTAGNINPSSWSHNSEEWVAITLSFPGADPCNANNSGHTDTDGDNVSDICDLDDDNDGILDVNEICNSTGTGNIDINTNFGTQSIDNSDNGTYPTTLTGINVTYTFDETGGTSISTLNLNGANEHGQIFKFNGSSDETGSIDMVFSKIVSGAFFKLTDFDEQELVTVNVYDHDNNLVDLSAGGYVNSFGSQMIQHGNVFSTIQNPTNIDGDNISTDPIGSVLLDFTGQLISRIHVLIEHDRGSSIRFIQVGSLCEALDTDGDGIYDNLDLDSDGDGCSDADEAYANTDTDGDDDEVFGLGTPNVDSDGLVLGASYATPAMTGSGSNTFQQGMSVSISVPLINQTILTGNNVTLTSAAIATILTTYPATTASTDVSYQWLVSTDGGSNFSDLVGESGTVSSGSNVTLTLTNVTKSMDENLYKIVYTNEANICGAEDEMELTVHDPPVATANESLSNPSGDVVQQIVTEDDGDGTDTDPDGTLDLSSIDLDPTISGIQSSLMVTGEGTWSVDGSGNVTFAPVAGFTNDPTPIDYTISDNDGNVSNVAEIVVDYVPVATADVSTGNTTNTNVILDVLGNDTTGDEVDATTVNLTTTGLPAGSTCTATDVSGDCIEVTVPGQGMWSVNETTGAVTFDPASGFTSNPTVLTYEVEDEEGNTTSAGITIEYDAQAPVATSNESLSNPSGDVVQQIVTEDDGDGTDTDPDGTLDLSSIDLDPTMSGIQSSLMVTGEGTWSVDGSGNVTFAPVAGFTNDPTPIDYTISDNDGNVSNVAEIVVDYVPVATADVSTGNTTNTNVTVDVLGNDTTGDEVDATTVNLTTTGLPAGSTCTATDVSGDCIEVTVPGQGIWSVNETTGAVTFDPASGFTSNPTVITYEVEDEEGNTTSAGIMIEYEGCIQLNLRVYLEGAIVNNGGASGDKGPLMRDDLRSSPYSDVLGTNYIPMNEPYSALAAFTHVGSGGGEVATATAFDANGDNSIVDWVFIELRDKNDSTSISLTRSALLQKDGDVVDVDGVSPLVWCGLPDDTYFISVRHRNHLGVMTKDAELITPGGTEVDFTNGNVNLSGEFDFGLNHPVAGSDYDYSGLAQKTTQGARVMWLGNSAHNNKIKYESPGDDKSKILFDVLLYPSNTTFQGAYDFAFGYLDGDVNMDSKAKYEAPGDDQSILLFQLLLYPHNSTFQSAFDFMYEQLPN